MSKTTFTIIASLMLLFGCGCGTGTTPSEQASPSPRTGETSGVRMRAARHVAGPACSTVTNDDHVVPASAEAEPTALEETSTPRCEPAVWKPVELSAGAQKVLQQCQMLSPAAPHTIHGVDCVYGNCNQLFPGKEASWAASGPINWQFYAQGEYIGPARLPHVPIYRLRVDDQLELVYRVTRNETAEPYQLNVGDEIRVESFTDPGLNRDLIVQPDGSITLRLLGQVQAARHTVEQLRQDLEEMYKRYYHEPSITVTPTQVNTKLEDLRATVDSRFGQGGQSRPARVTPEGVISLPVVGTVFVQGLTLDELEYELNARYALEIEGIEVTPVLTQRAPRFVFVLGEVASPGRFELEGPTTVIGALALAGSWNVGANIRQVVVFRRGEDWRLMATMLDLRGALLGKRPCPSDEIWIRDSDIVIVPKSPILLMDEFIELVFTRGVYGVMPTSTTLNFTKLSTL